MTSTHIRDVELTKMAMFKLGETARRVAMLAKEAETPSLRRLLTMSSELLERRARELQALLENEPPKRTPVLPVSRPRQQAPRARGLRLADARAPRLAARG